jgi:hypothetical protein
VLATCCTRYSCLTIIRKLGYILYRGEEWNGGKIEEGEMKFLREVSEDVPN